jgi:predicted nucleic acid-binding protein
MGFFDEAIAATALARREKILACDSDYDRFAGLAINPFEL